MTPQGVEQRRKEIQEYRFLEVWWASQKVLFFVVVVLFFATDFCHLTLRHSRSADPYEEYPGT